MAGALAQSYMKNGSSKIRLHKILKYNSTTSKLTLAVTLSTKIFDNGREYMMSSDKIPGSTSLNS